MEHGLLMVYAGHSEGASAAALGQVFRSLGRGLRVAVVQLVLGGIDFRPLISTEAFQKQTHWYGPLVKQECESLPSRADCSVEPLEWQSVKKVVESGKFDLVVLDRLLDYVKIGMIDEESVLDCLANRPEGVTVIVTGESASEDLVDSADLVTEVTDLIPVEVKDPDALVS